MLKQPAGKLRALLDDWPWRLQPAALIPTGPMSCRDLAGDVSGRKDPSSAVTSLAPSSSCPVSGERQITSGFEAGCVHAWHKHVEHGFPLCRGCPSKSSQFANVFLPTCRALPEPSGTSHGNQKTSEDPLQASHSAPELLQTHADSSTPNAATRDARRLAKNRATAAVSRCVIPP